MKLPQCEINFNPTALPEEILLVSGGRQPDKNYFTTITQDRKIFCADRGIELCRETNTLPEFLLGDFDSAFKDSVRWAIDNKIPIEVHPVDKDFTDFQLAIDFIEKNYKKNPVLVTGTFGGRADHLFSTIFTCANSKLKICLADDQEIILFLKDHEDAEIKFFDKPAVISLLPMTEICTGVTIDNVHWQLDNAKLFQKLPNAVSNRLAKKKDNIKISLRKGILAIYFCFKIDNAID